MASGAEAPASTIPTASIPSASASATSSAGAVLQPTGPAPQAEPTGTSVSTSVVQPAQAPLPGSISAAVPSAPSESPLQAKATAPADVAAASMTAPAPAAAPAVAEDPNSSVASRRPTRRVTRPSIKLQLSGYAASTTGHASASNSKAPRLKVKMSKQAGSTPKNAAYMHNYNRELDSSDDEGDGDGIAFEEQLIFRMPAGKDCDKLREMVKNRQVGESGFPEVSLEFKDSRRAVFKFGSTRFSAKLVDLPTITESHKVLENKQMFKIADISQMLLVEEKITSDYPTSGGGDSSAANGSSHRTGSAGPNATGPDAEKGFDVEDFIYPHGITPPMHWARKRRFRRRAIKKNIETVEKEVERLLEEDELAEKVEFEVIDEATLDHLSDSEMGDAAPSTTAATPRPMSEDGDSLMGETRDDSQAARKERRAAKKARGDDDDDEDDDDENEVEDEDKEPEEDEVDEDLAAALDAALEEAEEEETDSEGGDAADRDGDGPAAEDDEDADEEEEDEDEDEEQTEQRIRVNQLEAECREIDAMVKRKQADVDRAANPMIKQRLERSLKALQAELESKRAQLLALRQEREHRKEEAAQAEAEAEEERNREAEENEKKAAEAATAQAEGEAEEEGDAEIAATRAPGTAADRNDEEAGSPAARKQNVTDQPIASSSGTKSSSAGQKKKTSQQGDGQSAAKAKQPRISSLKDVLIGEASSRSGSASLPNSQRASGSNSAAPSPAASTAVPMDVDVPASTAGSNVTGGRPGQQQSGGGEQRARNEDDEDEDDEDEEEDEDDEDDEDAGEAGAAPNEDSDAEDEDEGLWS
ncbi:hypothetical protein OC846_004203 [Tilletia horrida]|uniref:TAFII55 protein conserved region domain-containing protein n=1 Tax=Tilletia horrida TaxID=155126 RepID=A0AAN6GMN2_9BASI|nr:hypothetical protein OC846_004203 [Tilletia horrida]